MSSPVAGLRVLFTGTMTNATRDDMKKRARALGATLASGVSKSLDLLVIGEKPSASKVARGRKSGRASTDRVRIPGPDRFVTDLIRFCLTAGDTPPFRY